MALIKCKECGKEISDQAGTCPNCGCPVNNRSESHVEVSKSKKQLSINAKIAIVGVIIVFALLAIFLATRGGKPKGMTDSVYEYGKSAVSYADKYIDGDSREEAAEEIERIYNSLDGTPKENFEDGMIESSVSRLDIAITNSELERARGEAGEVDSVKQARNDLADNLNIKKR